MQGDATAFAAEMADVVLANVHYDLPIKLADIKDFQQKNWFILSGLMRSQARDMEARMMECQLRVE